MREVRTLGLSTLLRCRTRRPEARLPFVRWWMPSDYPHRFLLRICLEQSLKAVRILPKIRPSSMCSGRKELSNPENKDSIGMGKYKQQLAILSKKHKHTLETQNPMRLLRNVVFVPIALAKSSMVHFSKIF